VRFLESFESDEGFADVQSSEGTASDRAGFSEFPESGEGFAEFAGRALTQGRMLNAFLILGMYGWLTYTLRRGQAAPAEAGPAAIPADGGAIGAGP
jgi:hypothetical protein